MRGRIDSRYEQFETSPDTSKQELQPAVCEPTDFRRGISIDCVSYLCRPILGLVHPLKHVGPSLMGIG